MRPPQVPADYREIHVEGVERWRIFAAPNNDVWAWSVEPFQTLQFPSPGPMTHFENWTEEAKAHNREAEELLRRLRDEYERLTPLDSDYEEDWEHWLIRRLGPDYKNLLLWPVPQANDHDSIRAYWRERRK